MAIAMTAVSGQTRNEQEKGIECSGTFRVWLVVARDAGDEYLRYANATRAFVPRWSATGRAELNDVELR